MHLERDRNNDGIDRKITRAANGKPYLENSEMKISIAHSRTVLLVTAGRDDQGCDIEFVEERTKQEWEDLLENRFADVLKQLSRIDDDVNVSATRLWCVREALIKSFGMVPLNISVEKVNGSGIVFKAMTGDKNNRMVLTFPVQALPGNTFIISFVISLKKENGNHHKDAVAAPFFHDQGRFSFSFLTTFKDCKNFYGKTHFSNFPDWMGNLRELVLAPIGQLLLSDLESGEYGMVTNTSGIRILQEAGALNEITGNMWITDQSDLANSFIDLHFDFTRKHPESGALQKIAECSLTTTWVKIESRGIVKKSPIPEYFRNFLNEHIRPVNIENKTIRKDAYPSVKDIGKPLYENKDALRPKILIGEREFHTGLTNGNTVGNLYYSNYYHWQAKVIEQYLFKMVPDVFKGNGKQGEFITLESEVKHLQEAMPFESILVNMYIDKLYEKGLKFYFEYFSIEHAGKRKLAYGSNTVIWCKRLNEKSDPLAQSIPARISETVMMTTR
jgi:acyl-CoA thioesterase FadM